MIFRLFIAFIPLFAGFWIATQKLAELSEKYLGGTAQVLLVTKENPEISLD